jgi:hypothetical protein
MHKILWAGEIFFPAVVPQTRFSPLFQGFHGEKIFSASKCRQKLPSGLFLAHPTELIENQ